MANPDNDLFSERQRQTIGEIVAAAMQQMNANQNLQQQQSRPPSWRDSEVGFFQPDLDPSSGDGDAVTVGTDTVYRDVNLFIDRLKDAVAYHGQEMVRQRIPALLRGAAQMWYSTGLDDLSKAGLRHAEIELWYSTLRNQFRRPLSKALMALANLKYTFADARERKPISQYIFTITKHARDAGMNQPMQQLTYAFNGIDARLRQSITEPDKNTTIPGFLRQLEQRRDTWAEVAGLWKRDSYSNAN